MFFIEIKGAIDDVVYTVNIAAIHYVIPWNCGGVEYQNYKQETVWPKSQIAFGNLAVLCMENADDLVERIKLCGALTV